MRNQAKGTRWKLTCHSCGDSINVHGIVHDQAPTTCSRCGGPLTVSRGADPRTEAEVDRFDCFLALFDLQEGCGCWVLIAIAIALGVWLSR
ncbi:MAG: hypothetical protein QF752_09085 [Planctomycetota bacterium]|nr:hypothetical protein [Planctomycetota bacterium]